MVTDFRSTPPLSLYTLSPMDFAFSEEQEMLRTSAREFLAKQCPSSYVRRMMEEEDAWDPAFWARLAEMGWTGLGIPEEYGGVGTFLDLVVVLEEAGRALLPGPFFSTMGLAVPALLEAGGEAHKKEVLTAIAADHMIVAARTRSEGEDGVTLFLVSGRPSGMTVKPLKTLDMTRRWYEVRFDGVVLPASAVVGAVDQGWAPLRRALDWAAAGLCAEMVGGAQHVLDTSVEYAKTRQQFGKPIGIYQAVSHKLADMLLETESARSATYYAAWAVDADAPDRTLAASMAKAYTSDAYRRAAGNGIQVHGGIGFTWEHDMHLYFKRAKAFEVTLGDARYHRELVAQALDL